jgi:hypothetical protein
LGERFVSLGIIRSALEIFERLEMWDDVVSCYQMLEKEKEAEAVVRRQLELNPRSPKLICLLGDIKKDPKYYEEAWALSDGHYARAMRSLGAWYFKFEKVCFFLCNGIGFLLFYYMISTHLVSSAITAPFLSILFSKIAGL